MKLTEVGPEALAALEAQVRQEQEIRKKKDPVSYFPWHPIQRWCFEAFEVAEKDVRVVLACGGNRGGKSALGKGVYSRFMRRATALAHKLTTVDQMTGEVRKKNDTDPVTVWIIPPTLEKARQDWVNPSDQYSIQYWLGDLFIDEKKTPDHIFYSRPPGMPQDEADRLFASGDMARFDKTILKSHDQDLLSFEASAVDLVIVDEELQDQAKWNSIIMRIGTSNGTVMMCYTPLYGLTWSYDRFWKPLVKMHQAREVQERCWIHDQTDGACVVAVQFGAGDNPLAKDYAIEVESDPGMSDAEKAARLHGEYGFVEGALVPALSGLDVLEPEQDHKIYVVDKLPGEKGVPGKIIEWLLVTDPNKSYGATLAGRDTAGNIFFVSEHLETSWPDRLHAEAFKKMEKKWVKPDTTIRRVADPGSAGAQSIVNMQDLGLFFETAVKGAGSVSESVKRLRSYAWVDPKHPHPITNKMGAPRVYFYRPGIVNKYGDDRHGWTIGCRLADQISQARQTDKKSSPPDTPHKDTRSRLDLFDCARYTVMCVGWMEEEEHPSFHSVQPNSTLPKGLPLGAGGDYTSGQSGEEFFLPDWEF